jgi:hypothetical protein
MKLKDLVCFEFRRIKALGLVITNANNRLSHKQIPPAAIYALLVGFLPKKKIAVQKKCRPQSHPTQVRRLPNTVNCVHAQ